MFDPFSLDDDDDDVAADTPGVRVTLRIAGDTLDPDFVTQHLGVSPTVGDAELGEWSLTLAPPPGTELGDAIDMLLARVPNDATLWEELADTYAVGVHCALELHGARQTTAVDVQVLERLTHLRLPLTLTIAIE